MPDFEDMILARQEERDILEDECNGECEQCPYCELVPDFRGWSIPEFTKEPVYRCAL